MLTLDNRSLRPLPELAEPDRDDDAALLVQRLQRGEREAEELLYRRYARYVAGTVARLVGSLDETEDVLHDTFLIAFAKIRTLRSGQAVRAWLAQIAVSQVHRRLRRKRLLRRLGLDRGADNVGMELLASAECGAETRADLARIDAALAGAPLRERSAWVLRRVEGWSLDEVAAACRCSLATAKRRVAAADERIRKVVGLEITGPEGES